MESTGSAPVRSTETHLLRRLDEAAFGPRHARIYLTALAGHFFDGFTINVTGFVLPGLIALFGLTTGQAGLVSSVLFAGMLVGAAVAGAVSDRYGRRLPLAASLVFFAVFSLLAAAAWSFPVLLVARLLQGVGLGAEIAIVLPYIAEFVPTKKRGPLVTLATATWLIGLPVAAAIAIVIVPALSWRGMFLISAIPLIIGVVVALTLPESVRYLLRRGRRREAAGIVGVLTRAAEPVELTDAPRIPDSERNEVVGSIRGLFRGTYRRYTISVWIMEVCAGAFLYGLGTWLPTVFKQQGIGLLSSFAYTAIITAAGVLGAVVAGQLVNKIGRRWALGPSLLLGGVFCLVWGGVHGTAAVIVIGALATFFHSGVGGSTLYVYASELYPTANRATGLGWAAGMQKVGGLIMPLTVGFVLSWHLPSYVFFALFAVISIVGGISGLLATFETSGKSVEQIADELNARSRVERTAEAVVQ